MADKFPDPKVGDPVAYYGTTARNGCPSAKLAIERVTATQIVVSGQKFKRDNGSQVGGTGSYYGGRNAVAPWTPEVETRIAKIAAEEKNRTRAVSLLKRIATAAQGLEIKRDRYGSGPRKWSALELERLHALVLTFEDGAAALKATLEPDFVPETKS